MENYFYAQLDEKNICVGVSSLSGEMTQDFMIQIDSMNSEILGMKYIRETNTWESVVIPPLPYVPTQLDLIQANVDYLMAVSL